MFDDVLTFATNQDAYEYVTKNLPRISHGASRDSLTRYTGSGYSSVNTLLRQAEGGALGNSTAATHIRNIDKAMDASRLADDVLFYRGSSFNEFSLPGTGRLSSYIPPPEPESLIGTVHTQHGYWSVSYGGVDAQGAFGGDLQLVIRAPKGTQAVDATQLSRFGTSEREVILGRGQQFFIHSVEWRNPQGWVAEVEILPKGVTADMVRGMVPMPRPK